MFVVVFIGIVTSSRTRKIEQKKNQQQSDTRHHLDVCFVKPNIESLKWLNKIYTYELLS